MIKRENTGLVSGIWYLLNTKVTSRSRWVGTTKALEAKEEGQEEAEVAQDVDEVPIKAEEVNNPPVTRMWS